MDAPAASARIANLTRIQRISMKLRAFTILSTLLLSLSACDAEPAAESASSDDDRGAAGKADVAGSCKSEEELACGGRGFGTCWCDESCIEWGDCCADAGEECGIKPECDPLAVCAPVLTCVDGEQYPTNCGPDNCDEPTGPCDGAEPEPEPDCDPLAVCAPVLTCVDGEQYPTNCGPDNCDEPTGPCDGAEPEPEPDCDPLAVCAPVLTCIDGEQYPTNCGPDNCDEPTGPCDDAEPEPEPECDPFAICAPVLTCVDGEQYPTNCGPDNCDEPIGAC